MPKISAGAVLFSSLPAGGRPQGPRIKVCDPMLGADFGKIAAPEPCLVEQKARLPSRLWPYRRDKQALCLTPAGRGGPGCTTTCDDSAQLGRRTVHGSGRGDQEPSLCRSEKVGYFVQEIRMEGQLIKGCVERHAVFSNRRSQSFLRALHHGQRDLRGHKRLFPCLRCNPASASPGSEVECGEPGKFSGRVLGGCDRMNVSHCPAL